MKLLKYEFKKLFSSRILFWLIALILAAGALLCLVTIKKSPETKPYEQYISDFDSDVRRIIRLAELNLADFSEGDNGGYVIDYQNRVIEKYTAILDRGVTPSEVRGYGEYALYQGKCLILLIVAIVFGAASSLIEKDTGMTAFIAISKRGRRALGAKLLTLFLISATVTLIYSASVLGICAYRFGLCGLFAPIQSLSLIHI